MLNKKIKRKEIYELRERNKKVFDIGNGCQQAIFYPSDIHVFNEETGVYEETDNSILEDLNSKHFVCGKNRFTAKFSREEDNDELFSIEKGMHRVTVCARKDKKHKNMGVIPALKNHDRRVLSYSCVENSSDYEYSVSNDGVKENIIIREKARAYRYPFILTCENVTAEFDEKTKRIAFRSNETGQEVFYIPAPYMIDNKGVTSTAVWYEMKHMDSGEIYLTVTADSDFINAEEREFPVTIDPQINVTGEGTITTYSWRDNSVYSYSLHSVGTFNNGDGNCNAGRMYISLALPSLPRNPRITKAELIFSQFTGTCESGTYPLMGLYRVNENIQIGEYTPAVDDNLIDFAKMKSDHIENDEVIKYSFDITTFIDQMSKNEITNHNLVLKMLDESSTYNDNITLCSHSYGTDEAPKLVITYDTTYGLDSSHHNHSHDLGRFGQGSIDLQCGNLMFDAEDFVWNGNRLPVTIKHLYNSALSDYQYTKNNTIGLHTADFSAMKLGLGFRLNIMQSIQSVSFMHDGNSYLGYVYIDENGNEMYFKENDNCVRCDDNSQCYHLFEDISENGMLYDPVKNTLSKDDDTYLFDTLGRLIKITDAYGNHKDITYTDNRISSVTDGAGREFDFVYNTSGYLTSITSPNNTTISYSYSGDLLSTITYEDERKAVISYIGNKPSSVTLQDDNSKNIYKVTYTFSGNRLVNIGEYGVENNAFVLGISSAYSYSVASGRTLVTTTEQADEVTNNVITTVYAFDDDGNVVSNYVYSEDTGSVGIDGSNTGINPYSGDGIGIVSNINNLLVGHNFETLDNWTSMPDNLTDLSIKNYASESSTKFGKKLLRVQSQNADTVANGVYQESVMLPAGKYTFSIYCRVLSSFKGNGNIGGYIRVVGNDGTVLAVSEHLTKRDTIYTRLIAPFTIDADQKVNVQILLDGKGTIYADGAQLENNEYANAYNMLENGNFELDTSSWNNTSGVHYTTDEHFNMSRSLMMYGDIESNRYAYQTVTVRTNRSTRESFTLSGWAKGYGLPDYDRDGVTTPEFRLRAVISYYDTYYKEYGSEEFIADFCPCTEEWQFASVQFFKSKYRVIKDISVFCDYSYNSGTVYFDDIQLVRDSIESNLVSSDFANDTDDDTEFDETPETNDSAPSFNEAKDSYGNTLTETTFTDGEFGTIYGSFGYDPDGNNLICETDARGNSTTYVVNENTSKNEMVIDKCGNKTDYEYDESGRIIKITSKKEDNTTLCDVAYTYDSFDQMTEIVRGDGMKYDLAYNAFHNLESIGINGKNEKLITYSYKNGNGKLKQITYANGHTMKATYNSMGQLIGEKWYETEAQSADENATPIAHYKYVYDGQGNIVRSIDVCKLKEYIYEYEDDKLIKTTECNIEIANSHITSRVVANVINYFYNKYGNITKKIITPTGTVSQVIQYEYNGEQIISKCKINNNTVTSYSKTDDFGRKTFDEIQIGTDFISKQFSYQIGKVPDAHKENSIVKSSAVTQLVSQIILSNGITFNYEYDAEERITSVTETFTDENGVLVKNTILYTYDSLGQLLTEIVNGKVENTMTYDNYGNIMSKNGVTYVYGDDVWKDKLTKVGGLSINYDKQGNPINYLGNTLIWEKGRQLKRFGGNTYSYNANGVRTSKTVNGVVHNYIVEGAQILLESWNENVLIPLYDNEESVCGIIYDNIPFYFQKNLQGDIIAIVNSAAKTIAKYTYDAWGVCTIEHDISSVGIAEINPFRYRGYYYDEEIKMYYLQSRYYDPFVGRFINSDSTSYINYTGTVISNNIECYCENSPINATDYFGHSWFKDKIVNKIKGYASKAKKTVEKAVSEIKTKTKAAYKKVVTKIESAVQTAGGFIAQKVTVTLVKLVSGIAVLIAPSHEENIKNISGHITDTINNETAKDFWNIYCKELLGTVVKEIKPVAAFTWKSIKDAAKKCWENKSFSSLEDDWNTYITEVKRMVMGMTESVNNILDVYNKMKVEPLSLEKSNENYKNNNMHEVNKNWYKHDTKIQYRYIKDQDHDVMDLVCGDNCKLEDSGCGFIASYNIGKYFDLKVNLSSIVYWYEQNSGLVLGGKFGINPHKISEFIMMLNLEYEKYETLEELEKSTSIADGVYIISQWNNSNNVAAGAHNYMVINTSSGLLAYNNTPDNKNTFHELLNGGTLICAYRIYKK